MCEDVRFLQDTQEKTAYFRHFLHVEYIEHVMLYGCMRGVRSTVFYFLWVRIQIFNILKY